MSIFELRKHFTLGDYNTSISREDFEKAFTKTKETIRFTFNGWDGKSYNGETRTARVLHCNVPGYEQIPFVKVGKAVHDVSGDFSAIEKSTGKEYPVASWVFDVRKSSK